MNKSTMFRIVLLVSVAALAALLFAACGSQVGLVSVPLYELNAQQEAPAEGSTMPDVTSEPYLMFEHFAPLQPMDGHGADASVQVLTREEDLAAYPCSSCHVKPVQELTAESQASGQLAHWDVVLDHAGDKTMSCTTCHNTDADVDQLKTLTGQLVDYDASYQVCAQCHAGEYEEWLGGAHGKRVGGWAPPRVIQNCADCHNPHEPAWDIRWPAMPPRQVQEGR
jgi:hypothetical protein